MTHSTVKGLKQMMLKLQDQSDTNEAEAGDTIIFECTSCQQYQSLPAGTVACPDCHAPLFAPGRPTDQRPLRLTPYRCSG